MNCVRRKLSYIFIFIRTFNTHQNLNTRNIKIRVNDINMLIKYYSCIYICNIYPLFILLCCNIKNHGFFVIFQFEVH